MKVLNLDALLTAERSALIFGESYPMRPITARVAMLCDAASRASGAEQIAHYVDAVCALVPALPREKALDLTVEQIANVIRAASTEVSAIEDAVGNAPSPVGTPGLPAT